MNQIRRILAALLITMIALLILLVGSVAGDALLGQGRVDAVTNITLDGPVPVKAYVARPEGAGPFPAVIMIHEFYGLRPEIVEKAEALAREGYVVVAPDTYRGQTTNWIPRAIYLTITTDVTRVNADLDTVFNWLTQQSDVTQEKIAVMGFCYGGGKALQYSLHSDRVAATGIFYGSLETDPDLLRRLPGPVLGIFGADDGSIPVETVTAFEAGLESAGISHQITVYDGVGHAFVTDVAAIEAGGAPGAAWAEFLAFLQQVLKS